MLIIVALSFVVFGDVTIGNIRVPGVLDKELGVRQGLDLVGGSVIVFEPDVEEGYKVKDDEMVSAEGVLRARLDRYGYYDATISRQNGTGLRVEIPNIDNPQEAVQLIGKTAALNFMDAEGNVVMAGTDEFVKSAQARYGQLEEYSNSEYYVALTLTSAGRKAFKEATAAAAARPSGSNVIVIMLDDAIISAPSVKETIDSEDCVISGSFNKESSDELAALINAGRLPFALKSSEVRSVGPTLGQEALNTSLFAALIGVILVMLFMLLVYRLPGLAADVSLVAYISIVCVIMAGFFIENGFRVTLTLPGIAGVILSIGMAVDANVVIFERIKDELKGGKSVGASVDSGFKRAITAVIDSNVTTLISCAVLYLFGTGTIKGFAVTLFIGVAVSLVTAIFLTRFLLRVVVGFGVRNPWLYGASKRRDA